MKGRPLSSLIDPALHTTKKRVRLAEQWESDRLDESEELNDLQSVGRLNQIQHSQTANDLLSDMMPLRRKREPEDESD